MSCRDHGRGQLISSVAITHDYLTQRGGAERVVLRLAAIFPGAPIFTSIYSPAGTYPDFENHVVHTSRLQGHVNPERFRWSAPRYPRAFRELDLSGFDTVIVSSSGFAHHIRHPRSFVYCYTPPRFLYEPARYFGSRVLAGLVWPALPTLRRLDRQAAAGHRSYAAISKIAADRVKAVYGMDPPVIHAPVWTGHLPEQASPLPAEPRALVVARLLPYKRVDVAISACRRTGVPLTIVGKGPDEARLRRMAGADVTFMSGVPDEEMVELFASHSVVLAPGLEDFGYGPVEANYSGRPVVALAAGGALETVRDHVTGRLVAGHREEDWAEALKEVLARDWSPAALRAATEPFQAPAFEQAVKTWILQDS